MINYNNLMWYLPAPWRINRENPSVYLSSKLKLPSGMTVEFGVDLFESNVISPYLSVYKKRTKFWPDNPSETTGRDGLIPASHALQSLKQLEDAIVQLKEPSRIEIYPDSPRLRDAYEKVLSRRGYYFDHIDGHKSLIKKINDEG